MLKKASFVVVCFVGFFPPLLKLEYFLQQKTLACQDFCCLVSHEIFKMLVFLFFNWPRSLIVKAQGVPGAQGFITVQHLFLSYLPLRGLGTGTQGSPQSRSGGHITRKMP